MNKIYKSFEEWDADNANIYQNIPMGIICYSKEAWNARQAEIDELKNALISIRNLVNIQAEDEGLWSVPLEGLQPFMEAHLQRELRKLHALIEEYTNES